MEQIYIEQRKYVYANVEWDKKGCFERMITSQKNSLVARVNKFGRNKHGLYLSIVCPENVRLQNPISRR